MKTREDLARIGQGDVQRGYDKILDGFIASWNAGARKNKFIPPTSRENGMEWKPNIWKISAEWKRLKASDGDANNRRQRRLTSG